MIATAGSRDQLHLVAERGHGCLQVFPSGVAYLGMGELPGLGKLLPRQARCVLHGEAVDRPIALVLSLQVLPVGDPSTDHPVWNRWLVPSPLPYVPVVYPIWSTAGCFWRMLAGVHYAARDGS